MAKEYINVSDAKAFVEANYQGDPLLRHLYITLLDKLPKVEAVPVRDNTVIVRGKQPVGAMAFCYACPKCANIGSDRCHLCKCEVEGGFEPKIEVETRAETVELVRCKDCKHYEPDGKYGEPCCRHPDQDCEFCDDCWLTPEPDGFCYRGERRTNGV